MGDRQAQPTCCSWRSGFDGWYGLKYRSLDIVRAIGVDQIHYGRGHHHLTLAYQIDAGLVLLLRIGQGAHTGEL